MQFKLVDKAAEPPPKKWNGGIRVCSHGDIVAVYDDGEDVDGGTLFALMDGRLYLYGGLNQDLGLVLDNESRIALAD